MSSFGFTLVFGGFGRECRLPCKEKRVKAGSKAMIVEYPGGSLYLAIAWR